MSKMQAKFTFSAIDYPESNKLCFNNIAPFKECDCCWAIYMPVDLEYSYTEYLAKYNINYEKKDYVNMQHLKDATIIYFQNEIKFLKEYDYTKISDDFAPCAININNNTIARYKTLRDMYMDIADRIINVIEDNMYNLISWSMHHNFINILKKKNSISSDDLFDFSNNGKEIISIRLVKNVPKITTV